MVFFIWNLSIIMFLTLLVISRKQKLSHSFITICLFSLLTWFTFGNGLTSYIFSLDVKENAHQSLPEDTYIDEDGFVTFKDYKLSIPVHVEEIDYVVHKNITKPYFQVDNKIVKNVFVKFITGGKEEVPKVKVFVPIQDFFNIDKLPKKEEE